MIGEVTTMTPRERAIQTIARTLSSLRGSAITWNEDWRSAEAILDALLAATREDGNPLILLAGEPAEFIWTEDRNGRKVSRTAREPLFRASGEDLK